MTKPRKRKVPNASIIADDDDTVGKDQGDRADNEEEGSVGTDVGEAEDDVCLTVPCVVKHEYVAMQLQTWKRITKTTKT